MNALPQSRTDIAALIPHQGDMCLLERVDLFDAEHINCSTRTHREPDSPLRYRGRISAVHLCEYGAQATAVHGALLAAQTGERAPPGWLVAVRDVQLHASELQNLDAALQVSATLLHNSATGCAYTFTVSTAEQLLASGQVTIMNWRAS